MLRIAIVVFMLVVALYTVTRRRPFEAIFGRTILGTFAIALYATSQAPDVALVEALLGVVLSTFVYITAFKAIGRVRAGYVAVGEEILQGLRERVHRRGYEVEFVKYGEEKLPVALKALEEGYLDILVSSLEISPSPARVVFPGEFDGMRVFVACSRRGDLLTLVQSVACFPEG